MKAILALLLLCAVQPSFAQSHREKTEDETEPAHFSILLFGGSASGVSASMRGTNAQFESDVEQDYNNSSYPFGDPNASGFSGGLELAYQFSESPWSAYAAGALHGFMTTEPPDDTAALAMFTVSLGAKYQYDLLKYFDVYGTAGLNTTYFGGSLIYKSPEVNSTVDVVHTTRYGFEIGAGAEFKFLIFDIGAFAQYTNANLIGKDYTNPGHPPEFIFSRALNDGANPNNPFDAPRTIDFLTIGISGGLRF